MGLCKGKTRKGDNCKRNAIEGQEYCYQHVNGWINKITYWLSESLGVKRKFLWVFIIVTLILFGINHKVDVMLTELEKKPDVNGFVVPFVQREPWGDFLPLMILNTGDLPLYNVTVGIQSCVMKNLNKSFEIHRVPLLLPYHEYVIKFGDSDTIHDFERMWCTPSSDYPYPSISFNPSLLNQSTMSTTTTCGYCFYTLKIYSDKINKTIEGRYRAPINISILVRPK